MTFNCTLTNSKLTFEVLYMYFGRCLLFGCSIFQLINLGAVIVDLMGAQLEVASTVTAGLAKPVEQGQCVAANGLKIAGDGFFYFLRRGCAALSCTQPFWDLPAELHSSLNIEGFGDKVVPSSKTLEFYKLQGELPTAAPGQCRPRTMFHHTLLLEG